MYFDTKNFLNALTKIKRAPRAWICISFSAYVWEAMQEKSDKRVLEKDQFILMRNHFLYIHEVIFDKPANMTDILEKMFTLIFLVPFTICAVIWKLFGIFIKIVLMSSIFPLCLFISITNNIKFQNIEINS